MHTPRGGRHGNVIPGILVRCNEWEWWGTARGEDGTTTRVLVGEIAWRTMRCGRRGGERRGKEFYKRDCESVYGS